jgi:hypothetical protein
LELDPALLHDLGIFIELFAAVRKALELPPVTGRVSLKTFLVHPIVVKLNVKRPIGELPIRTATVSVASLKCQDLNVTLGCLVYIAAKHYRALAKCIVAELHGSTEDFTDSILISKFQCSALSAELYDTAELELKKKAFEFVGQLRRVEVFPTGETHNVLSYRRRRFVNVAAQADQVDGQLRRRLQAQVIHVGRITEQTPEQAFVVDAVRKLGAKREQMLRILFLEPCEGGLLGITSQTVFLCNPAEKLFVRQDPIEKVTAVQRSGARIQITVSERKLWTKESELDVDFQSDDIAEHAFLLLTSLVAYRKRE